MSHLPRAFALLAAFALSFSAGASSKLNIQLANNSDAEKAKQQQLKRVLQRYELEEYAFTRDIMIDENAENPHSHPVLTLTTGGANRDYGFLSQYLHEQLQWFAQENQSAIDAAIEILKQRYPDAPVEPPMGAQDEHSTYLQLIVCTLEFDAMIALVGEQYARKVLAKNGQSLYRWVYDTVLKDVDQLRELLQQQSLTLS